MEKLQKIGFTSFYISFAIAILFMLVSASFAQWPDKKEAQINAAVKRAEQKAKNLPDNEKKIEWFVLQRINKMIANNAKLDHNVKAHYSSDILFSDDSGRLYVDVALLLSASRSDISFIKNKIKEAGGKIKFVSNPQFQYPVEIYCWLPYYAIKEIAKLPQVGNISAVGVPMSRTGSITSIGDTQLRAEEARNYFNCDGSQIKVGVISNGAEHWDYSHYNGGDLPEAIEFVTNRDIPGDEGTAMMEIVYDMAPGAQLVFGGLDSTDGPSVMAELISNMFDNYACKIIVDDIGFYLNLPYFSDDPIMQRIQSELGSYPKRIYVSAAGNDAKNMFDAEHFQSDASNYVYFWQGQELYNSNFFSLGAHNTVHIFLQWADEWGYSTNNYDLYLLDGNGNIVASSPTVQNGMGSNPQEVINFTNQNDIAEDYYIRIKMGNEEREIKLIVKPGKNEPEIALAYTYPNYMNETKPTRQIFGHPASQGAICVAAYESDNEDTISDYSSNGPTNLYSFAENNASAVKEERKTPTITATSFVNTKIGEGEYFIDPFRGTSASAPHVAGIAALYFQKHPDDSRSDFLNALKKGAAPMGMIGNPGEWNSQSGFGKVDAYATVGKFISVTVSQLDEQLQSFGQIGLYINGNFSNYSIPYTFNWPENSTKTLRADQKFKSNTTQKYHDWNGMGNVINHHTFTISSNTRNIVAHFKNADTVVIRAKLTEDGGAGGQIQFKDPWLIDYADPNFGNNKRNQGMSAPFKQRQSPFTRDYTTNYNGDVYQGVFLDQSGPNQNWAPPYYSVKADAQQTFTAHGQDITGYFLNWEGTDVDFQSPNNEQTPIVFHANNAEARAVYKGHLASNTPLATAYNNGRRLILDSNGRYHLVYEDGGFPIKIGTGETFSIKYW